MTVREFIRICRIRAMQDQYTDPDAYRKALHAVEAFVEGLARVKLEGKVGFIDRTGKMVIPNEYSMACDFYDGFARVALRTGTDELDRPICRWGFIDKAGRILSND